MGWNAVECDPIHGTSRDQDGMGCYLREWNAMERNGMLGRASGMLTSGKECHGMVNGFNVMQQNAIEHGGMEWNVVQWGGM